MKICVDIRRQSNSIAILADFEDSLIFCPSRLIKKQSQLRENVLVNKSEEYKQTKE